MKNIINGANTVVFLENLDEKQYQLLLSYGCEQNVITGSVVLQQGKVSNNFYILTTGKLGIRNNYTGSTIHDTIEVGEMIGCTSLIEGTPSKVSVIAIENSNLLVIPIESIKKIIEQDPKIGIKIYQSIAKLNTKRLDNSYVYFCKRISDRENLVEVYDTALSQIESSILGLKKLLLLGDQDGLKNNNIISPEIVQKITYGFSEFTKNINSLLGYESSYPAQVKEEIGERIKVEILPYLLLTETAERMYSKPRGYAGDFYTIHSMYQNEAKGKGRLGPILDRCFLNEPAGRAVQNRRRIISDQIVRRLTEKKELKVTSIACGPATEVFDVFQMGNIKNLKVNCLDIDEEAIAFVEDRIEKYELSESITTYKRNLINLIRGSQTLNIPHQDLIYSIGLMDYFNDNFVIKFLNYFYDLLRPGGTVIIGNFHPRNTTKGLMDYVLDWKLIHRTEDDMNRIFLNSKFGKPCSKIIYEEQKVNLFAFCEK